MEYLLILMLVSPAIGIPTNQCNRLKIKDKFYEKEVLWNKNIGKPYNLIVHKPTNTLFFSFSKPETYSDVDFTLAFYNIDTHEYQTVAGIRGGCAVTIDTTSDDIYMGGSEGIYKFNLNTKIADFYKEKGKNIWSLFFRKNLFFISYPDQRLHLEIDGSFAVVKEFENFQVDYFFVSINNEIIFANETGLYRYDNFDMKIDVISELLLIRQIVDDDDGNVYVCTNLGIFTYNKYDGLRKILDNKYIFGLTFDKDNNYIVSDGNNLLRLRYSELGCDTEEFHW